VKNVSHLQNDPHANMQINHTNVASYGATEHVTGNPFAAAGGGGGGGVVGAGFPSASNPFAQSSMTAAAQPVQPYPTDPYLHGTTEDRDFANQYTTNY
jgi:hypothetical protein